MSDLLLYIGNKNYSSWSLRPWLAMTAAGVPFREELIPFDDDNGNPAIKAVSPNGKVPLLVDGTLKIWESLAIIEYVAEIFPDLPLWPESRQDRARARSICTQMATGFPALRNECPMNFHRKREIIAVSDGVVGEVALVETIWRDCLNRSGGPFLFGAFSAADAMYAPVVNRLEIYCLTNNPDTLSYMRSLKDHPAFKAWEEEALKEPWFVAADEV